MGIVGYWLTLRQTVSASGRPGETFATIGVMDRNDLSFDFITDEDLRTALEADYQELRVCADAHAWKAVHVLAGSIIEAVLVDYLVGTKQQKKPDPLQMSLTDLIAACRKAGVLGQKTADLSSALKSYRNLIHPGRARRLREEVNADGALVAQSLVSIIARDVASKQQEEHGYTAEQIVNKFASDPTAVGITRHLLEDASPREIERLLVKVLPERYFAELEEENAEDSSLESHTGLFRVAFDGATESVKKRVMARYVAVLKEEAGPRVQVYEEEFFRGGDVKYVSDADRELVKAHLLARLGSEPNSALLRATDGIGPFLTSKDVNAFVDPLVRLILRTSTPLGKQARKILEGEATRTPEEIDPDIVTRLETWAIAFDRRDAPDQAKLIRQIKFDYEVPF